MKSRETSFEFVEVKAIIQDLLGQRLIIIEYHKCLKETQVWLKKRKVTLKEFDILIKNTSRTTKTQL